MSPPSSGHVAGEECCLQLSISEGLSSWSFYRVPARAIYTRAIMLLFTVVQGGAGNAWDWLRLLRFLWFQGIHLDSAVLQWNLRESFYPLSMIYRFAVKINRWIKQLYKSTKGIHGRTWKTCWLTCVFRFSKKTLKYAGVFKIWNIMTISTWTFSLHTLQNFFVFSFFFKFLI